MKLLSQGRGSKLLMHLYSFSTHTHTHTHTSVQYIYAVRPIVEPVDHIVMSELWKAASHIKKNGRSMRHWLLRKQNAASVDVIVFSQPIKLNYKKDGSLIRKFYILVL